ILATKAAERGMELEKAILADARKYLNADMNPVTAKAYANLTKGKTLLPPDSAQERTELASLGTKMEGIYGSGKYCKKNTKGEESCRNLNELSDVMAKSRKYDELLDAWVGWHSVSPAYRKDYERYVEVANAGAKAY